MRDTTIPFGAAVISDPVPNPVINPLLNVAGPATKEHPEGQLTKMYFYSRLMIDSAFSSAVEIPSLYNTRVNAVLRQAHLSECFGAMNQVMTFLLDPSFPGFAQDATMKSRMLLIAASKAYTLLPDVVRVVQEYNTSWQALLAPTTIVSESIRQGAVDDSLIRSALVFQAPSMYESALHAVELYHSMWLLCRVLEGFCSIARGVVDTMRPEFYDIDQVREKLVAELSGLVQPFVHMWNYSQATVTNLDIPNGPVTQNLNAMASIAEKAIQHRIADYEEFVLTQFKRTTDGRTPNWLSFHMAFLPVSASAVTYSPTVVKDALDQLKRMTFAREV